MNSLKPCPFCGSHGVRLENLRSAYWVRCNVCRSSTDIGLKELVVSSWNRRSNGELQLRAEKAEYELRIWREWAYNINNSKRHELYARFDHVLDDMMKELSASRVQSIINKAYREGKDTLHSSDCSVHNAPAFEAGPCDCKDGNNDKY